MRNPEALPSRLRRFVLAAAARLGWFRLFAFFNRKKIAILRYHGVSARQAFSLLDNHYGKHVRLPLFRKHLDFLSRRYQVLPLPDVVHALRTGVPLPAYTAVITFDGGYENNATVALPCLLDAGMSAAFFLSTAYVGTSECPWEDQLAQIIDDEGLNRLSLRFGLRRETIALGTEADRREANRLVRWFCRQLPDAEKKTWLLDVFAENGILPPKAEGEHRFMTWDQVGELHAGGMSIGPHTMTRPIVTRLTPTEMREEIAGARAACEEHLGVPCPFFAYPYGRPGDFDQESNALLRRLGFSCALTTIHGLNPPDADLYTLKRIEVGEETSLDELEAHLSGLTSLARRLRRNLFG